MFNHSEILTGVVCLSALAICVKSAVNAAANVKKVDTVKMLPAPKTAAIADGNDVVITMSELAEVAARPATQLFGIMLHRDIDYVTVVCERLDFEQLEQLVIAANTWLLYNNNSFDCRTMAAEIKQADFIRKHADLCMGLHTRICDVTGICTKASGATMFDTLLQAENTFTSEMLESFISGLSIKELDSMATSASDWLWFNADHCADGGQAKRAKQAEYLALQYFERKTAPYPLELNNKSTGREILTVVISQGDYSFDFFMSKIAPYTVSVLQTLVEEIDLYITLFDVSFDNQLPLLQLQGYITAEIDLKITLENCTFEDSILINADDKVSVEDAVDTEMQAAQYRKIIRDNGFIAHNATMWGDTAFCEYVVKMAYIDRNYNEMYSVDWYFYDTLASRVEMRLIDGSVDNLGNVYEF